MADQKIWSNETGQVMLGAGGMVLRQPFNFDNGFTQGVNTGVFLSINPNVTINPAEISTLLWINNSNVSGRGFMAFPSDYGNSLSRPAGTLVNVRFTPPGNNMQPIVPSFALISMSKNNGVNYCYINALTPISNTGNPTAPIDTIILGKSALSSGFLSTARIGNFMLFNRHLSYEEHRYVYANGVGSLPLTDIGRVAYIKLNYAEVIDFSINNYVYDPLNVPVDANFKVACRDYSGLNNHAFFTGLPVGTLTEQMNWANANVFTPFIS